MLAALERALATRTRVSFERPRHAAVLLPLIGKADELSLVFTRRAVSIPMGGQVAFPGGRVEEGDADRTTTALREAEEEVGLPRSAVRILGLLDDLPTWDNQQCVTPVVGYCGDLEIATLVRNPAEVERIFSVPLRDLQDESRWVTKPMTWMGTTYRQFYFDVAAYAGEEAGAAEKLWGLSAYMAIGLLSIVPDAPSNFGRSEGSEGSKGLKSLTVRKV